MRQGWLRKDIVAVGSGVRCWVQGIECIRLRLLGRVAGRNVVSFMLRDEYVDLVGRPSFSGSESVMVLTGRIRVYGDADASLA